MNSGGLSLMSVTVTMMLVLEERGGLPPSVATTCVCVCVCVCVSVLISMQTCGDLLFDLRDVYL